MILRTRRLVLRPPRHSDVDRYLEIFRDPQVVQHLLLGETLQREEVEVAIELERMRFRRDGIGLFTIEHAGNGLVIGRAGLMLWRTSPWRRVPFRDHNGDYEVELGAVVAKAFWTGLYGLEACHAVLDWAINDLRVPRVIGFAAPDNPRAAAISRSLGMHYASDEFVGEQRRALWVRESCHRDYSARGSGAASD